MKFKMNYMNLIRYGESVRVGEARFFYRLNYRDIFTLNIISIKHIYTCKSYLSIIRGAT